MEIVYTETEIPRRRGGGRRAEAPDLVESYRLLVQAHPHVLTQVDQAVLVLGLHPNARACHLAAALNISAHQAQAAVMSARRKLASTGWTPGGSVTGILTWLCPECRCRFPAAGRGRTYCESHGLCRSISRYVRYHRRQLAKYGSDEAIPAEVMTDGVMDRRAFALGVGYDANARALSPARRAQVWTRDVICVSCGAPGEEIDHIEGPSPELSNLRLLCQKCHQGVTRAHFTPLDDEGRARLRLLDERVYAPEPLRPQDGPEWKDIEVSWVVANARLVHPGTALS